MVKEVLHEYAKNNHFNRIGGGYVVRIPSMD